MTPSEKSPSAKVKAIVDCRCFLSCCVGCVADVVLRLRTLGRGLVGGLEGWRAGGLVGVAGRGTCLVVRACGVLDVAGRRVCFVLRKRTMTVLALCCCGLTASRLGEGG